MISNSEWLSNWMNVKPTISKPVDLQIYIYIELIMKNVSSLNE